MSLTFIDVLPFLAAGFVSGAAACLAVVLVVVGD